MPMDAKRGATKRGEYTSILDRWQNDEVYRASQLVHGWTEEWVKYLHYISKIDISHDAPYRQRLRYESTIFMRSVDSKTQAGPLCQRPDYKTSADALVSLQRARGKGTTLRNFSSSSSSTWTESPTWWSSSSWDNQWQEWHTHGWEDKEWWDQR